MPWPVKWCASGVVVVAVMLVCQSVTANEGIAGLTPDRRPEGAPRIEHLQKSEEWFGRALVGVEPPVPYSLRFLSDQGNWYTPFNYPGMTGPYDIRGWHRGSAAGETTQ